MVRTANITRNTRETQISISLQLDGSGQAQIATGIGFFDHMLDQLARHGAVDLQLQCQGDLHIDAHHTVEDVGISLGQALAAALGDKRGITRFGLAYAPLDEALSRAVVDISGRPGLYMQVPFSAGQIGGFDTQLVYEFFQGLVNHAQITVHLDGLKGHNAHHQCESLFKAFARALRMAVSMDVRTGDQVPSTKGSL